jgi:hypothetical protein
MNTLLIVIAAWLNFTFDLPEIKDYPRVELVSPARLAALRYRGLTTDRTSISASTQDGIDPGRNVMAVYDDRNRTIYLREGWTGATPAETSVLVHELIHHVQNTSSEKYECPQEREKLAYRAQARWLELFGKTLLGEFEIDPMTVLVRTNCMD